MRVHSDHTAENLTIDSLPGGYDPSGHNIIIGDVDDNGHYWYIDNTTGEWVQVDLTTTPNPTFIVRGSAAGVTGSAGADWAFVPGTNSLYRIMNDAGDARLWSFDRTSKAWTNHTPVTPLAGITGQI